MAVPVEDQKQQTDLQSVARTIAGPVGQLLVATAILALIFIGVVILIFEVARGVQAKTEPVEEVVPEFFYNNSPALTSSYTSYQSRAAKDSIMTQVLNSID